MSICEEVDQNDVTSDPEDDEEEILDPRIQIELEKLNSSTDVINKLELDLEESRSTFRQLLSESGHHLSRLSRQLGTCVDKARPYYEARMRSRQALLEAQRAAARFEKASSAHEVAREMVLVAEEGYKERGMPFDQAWQEMLNHSTNRVNESELERNASAEEHREKSRAYQLAEQRVQELQRNLKRSINKSRPYFELKARLNQDLDNQKKQIQVIEETIIMTKEGYAESLRELERISEEIHLRRMRKKNLGIREAGVGADSPLLSSRRSSIDENPKPDSATMEGPEMEEDTDQKNVKTISTSMLKRQISRLKSESEHFRTQPVGASSTIQADDAQKEKSVASSNQPPPLPPRKFIPSLVPNDDQVSSASNATIPKVSSEANNIFDRATEKSSDQSKIRLVASENSSPVRCSKNQRVFPGEGRLQVPGVRRLMADDEDLSDTESLASMEMLDDAQIEELMKEMSLQSLANQLNVHSQDKLDN